MSLPQSLALLNDSQRTHEFPITAEYIYLNTATQGPLPASTCQAAEAYLCRTQFPETAQGNQESPVELARSRLAHLLGTQADNISFTSSTTHGLNICAQGIEWREGDNVVLPAHEFPSVTRTWLNLRRRGVDVRLVPWDGNGPSVETLMSAVDSRTRAVSCSAVAWDTGFRVDLEALGRRCAEAGCLLIVDGVQAVGATEFEPQTLGLSAVALHGYKWLLSGFGCGMLYVAPEALDRIQPTFVGAQSFQLDSDPADPEAAWQPGARRYAAGGANTPGLAVLAASLGLIEQLGLAAIAAHNRALGELLVTGLQRYTPHLQLVSPTDAARRASIVTYTLGNAEHDAALVQRLTERKIVVAHRPRGVRISPHFYNTAAEIEKLLEVLPECW